jgi:hypothetical protein
MLLILVIDSCRGYKKGFWSVSLLLRFHQVLESSSVTETKGNCPEYFYRFYPFLLCPIFTRISVLGHVLCCFAAKGSVSKAALHVS